MACSNWLIYQEAIRFDSAVVAWQLCFESRAALSLCSSSRDIRALWQGKRCEVFQTKFIKMTKHFSSCTQA